jgi:hypothetical protein
VDDWLTSLTFLPHAGWELRSSVIKQLAIDIGYPLPMTIIAARHRRPIRAVLDDLPESGGRSRMTGIGSC